MNHAAFVEHFFAFAHLPPHLREVSAPFANLAHELVASHQKRVEALAVADHAAVMKHLRNEPREIDPATARDLRLEADRLAGAEIAVALRKLREAKDCAVLAAVVLHKVTP